MLRVNAVKSELTNLKKNIIFFKIRLDYGGLDNTDDNLTLYASYRTAFEGPKNKEFQIKMGRGEEEEFSERKILFKPSYSCSNRKVKLAVGEKCASSCFPF